MELPYGINPFSGVLVEQYEENKIESPMEDGGKGFDGKLKEKRSKKPKATGTEEKIRARKAAEPGRETGHWNLQQKRKYHWFLEIYHSHFQNKHMRRMDKIFKTMADFLGSRAADQCRSHHQKMEKKYKNFYNIIYNLRVAHYGSGSTADLLAELRQIGLSLEDGLICEAQLEQYLQEKEEQQFQQQHLTLHAERPLLDLESPKWTIFEKCNIDKPLDFFMDLSNEEFNLI